MSVGGTRPAFPVLRPVGFSGMLVSFSDILTDQANRAALAFRALVEAAAIPGVIETSTSLVSTFVSFDPRVLSPDALQARLSALLADLDMAQAGPGPGRRLWRIPTAFGGGEGPQLDEAAGLAGVSPEQAIADLAARPLRVMAIGFAPGQPYLGTLAEHWNLPRQGGLTAQVPAGSVVVAVRQLTLFTNPSATGWRLVGQTGFRTFDPQADDAFALRPGDEVQLVPVSAADLADIRASRDGSNGGAVCEVLP